MGSIFMGKYDKLLLTILKGSSDRAIAFQDLRNLLAHFGFDERIKGSHHIFRKAGVVEMVNLQRDGNKAKAYQIQQLRKIILKYGLHNEK